MPLSVGGGRVGPPPSIQLQGLPAYERRDRVSSVTASQLLQPCQPLAVVCPYSLEVVWPVVAASSRPVQPIGTPHVVRLFKSIGTLVDTDRRRLCVRQSTLRRIWRIDRGQSPTSRTTIRGVDGFLPRRGRIIPYMAGLWGLRHLDARRGDGHSPSWSIGTRGLSHLRAPTCWSFYGHDTHG